MAPRRHAHGASSGPHPDGDDPPPGAPDHRHNHGGDPVPGAHAHSHGGDPAPGPHIHGHGGDPAPGAHAHAHSHAAHGHHAHALSPDTDRRQLLFALGLLLGLMVAEVVAGVLASSLALLSDAAHMLTDAGAIALSLLALRLAARPAGGAMTFGLKRAEILSAQANGLTLLLLALVVVAEGIRRLISPPDVEGVAVLAMAAVGAVTNLLAVRALARANRESLNVEGSFQHLLTDLYAFVVTGVAGLLVLLTGFARADALASLVIAALMLRSAYGLLRASARVFLEAAPEGVDPAAIGRALAAHPDVVEVHDLHVWEVTSGFPAFSAHVLVPQTSDCHGVRRQLEETLRGFGIEHTTMQVDHAPADRLLSIEVADAAPRPSGAAAAGRPPPSGAAAAGQPEREGAAESSG